MSQVAEVRR